MLPRISEPLSIAQILRFCDEYHRLRCIVPVELYDVIDSYGDEGFGTLIERTLLQEGAGFISDVDYEAVGLRPGFRRPDGYHRPAEVLIKVVCYVNVENEEDLDLGDVLVPGRIVPTPATPVLPDLEFNA